MPPQFGLFRKYEYKCLYTRWGGSLFVKPIPYPCCRNTLLLFGKLLGLTSLAVCTDAQTRQCHHTVHPTDNKHKVISKKNAFLQACPVHHWQAHTKATRQSSEFKVSHWVLAVAQGQCQWCAEPAGQSGPSLPYLGTPISEIVPCWRDCATQHWETGSPSGCPPTWRNKEPQILTLKAATYPSIL